MEPNHLLQTWLHAHEEDSGGSMVFRPSSHSFPPSRGRYGFSLAAGGRLTALGPSARDVPVESPGGHWALDDDATLTLLEAGSAPRRFQVEESSAARLILRPLP